MATKVQMQAKSSANGQLYSWLYPTPDFSAAGYVAAGYPGSAQDVALQGGGLDTTGSSSALSNDSGAVLTDDSGATLSQG